MLDCSIIIMMLCNTEYAVFVLCNLGEGDIKEAVKPRKSSRHVLNNFKFCQQQKNPCKIPATSLGFCMEKSPNND
jgi:hypothetical protein